MPRSLKRLTYAELLSDARRLSDVTATSNERDSVRATQEVLLVRKISLIDDVIASHIVSASLGGEDANQLDAELVQRREHALSRLRELRGPSDHLILDSRNPGEVDAERSPLFASLESSAAVVTNAEDEAAFIRAALEVFACGKGSASTLSGSDPALTIPLEVVATLAGEVGKASDGGAAKTQRDLSDHQSARDIERDALRVNGGAALQGSVGYAAVLDYLVGHLATLLPIPHPKATSPPRKTGLSKDPVGSTRETVVSCEVGPTSPMPFESLYREIFASEEEERAVLEGFASAILKAVNRTESGHWSFALIQRLFMSPVHAVIVPDSAAATPLNVDITRGPVRTLPSPEALLGQANNRAPVVLGWGLRADVSAITIYDIYDSECARKLLRISANYRHRLELPLAGPCSPQHRRRNEPAWERLGAEGSVTLRLVTAQASQARPSYGVGKNDENGGSGNATEDETEDGDDLS
mmetsp:Transcript_28268/g.63118  ORF Transcript_28268/g.63118 Transcript_28268/m.63118 type:complete len:471 (+) Transcript_28268:57-1469(+)